MKELANLMEKHYTVHSPLFFREIVEISERPTINGSILIFKCTKRARVVD